MFPSQLVLGKQAEACFETYINHSNRYNLLAANLQIQGVEKTLGELDYLVKDEQIDKILHIELACKFYLFDPSIDASEEEKWIGPNRKDSLFYKLEKLKTKQFPLLYAQETYRKLNEKAIDTSIIVQQICLKAFLFLPQKMEIGSLSQTFKNCVVGYWINYADFSVEDPNALYAIPNKKEWLLPLDTITEWYNFSDVKTEIERCIGNCRSPLIYKKTPTKTERFFVVWW